MSAPIKPWESSMHDRVNTMESVIPAVPGFINPTPSMSVNSIVPALPPRPQTTQPIYSAYGGGLSNSYSGFGNSFGGFGNSYGGLGGGYGGAGYMSAGYGSPYGGFNRFGPNGLYGDAESQFIQIAEERSRPAFQSIESVVGAVGSIAMMLENTFIAMTSSFRAILGVAENFGRLRSLFAQFWSTFAVIRSINWMIRKLLVMLGIRTEDEFKTWARAVADTEGHTETGLHAQRTRGSSWPILLFFGIVASAPYIILKLLSGLSTTIQEKLNDPKTWQNPMQAVAQHPFQATSAQELSLRANQLLNLAPQHLQGPLWNSGWLMASVDQKTAGLIPINYVKVIRNPNNVNPQSTSIVETPNVSATSNLLQKEDNDINASSNKPLSDIVGDSKPDVSILNEIYSNSLVSEKIDDSKHEL